MNPAELDTRIKKIPRVDPVQIIANNQSCFIYESNRETDKNESLADDNTTITLLDLESLQAARQILGDFGNISGLRCNYDKSVIMPTSDISEAERLDIQTLGFSIQTKITLLGVEISNKLDNLREITTKLKEKIISLIAFWERFRLSLPGRIAILKTCLISQLCYLGSFLPLDEAILDEIQILLDNFTTKNLKIAQSRIYLPAAYGRVGAINIQSFLTALDLSWFSRANSLCIDNWRYDLHANAFSNNIILSQADDLDKVDHSKKFRIILSKNTLSNADPNGLRIVNTFAISTGTQIPIVDLTKLALSSWNTPFLHNSFKDFIFKLRNNQLFTNDRLHAIDGLTDPGCAFCRILGNFPTHNESIRHIFLECPTTMDFNTRWCRQMEPAPNFLNNDDVTLYWYGGTDLNNDCKNLTFLFDSFRFIIWNFKVRKKLLNFNMFERELNFFVWCATNSNQSFKRKLLNINRVSNMLPARG